MLQLQIILQTIDIINFYWFSFGLITTSISFLLTNNTHCINIL